MSSRMSADIASLRLHASDRLALAEKIHSGLRPTQVQNLLAASGMTQEQLFEAAHIPVSTGRRRLSESHFTDHESERIARIARVFEAARDLFAGDRTQAWLREPNARLGGRTPLAAAGTELGALEVEALLGRLAHGVH